MNLRTEFETCRDILLKDQSYGTWSLIVTFFGDMAQGENDQVSGHVLTEICALLGVKSQAMRVALHRLRKDGWIDSVKDGRRSSYFLTPRSRIESAGASNRIYRHEFPEFKGMSVVVTSQKSEKLPTSGNLVKVTPQTFIGLPDKETLPEGAIVAQHQGPVPSWAKELFCPIDLQEAYQDFDKRLSNLPLKFPSEFSELETAALRVLLVHTWRRLVLRHGLFPLEFFPEDCAMAACSSKLSLILKELTKPSLEQLEKCRPN